MAETEELSPASQEAAVDMMIECAIGDLTTGTSLDSIETLLAAAVRYPSEVRVRWVLAAIIIVECVRSSYNSQAIVSQRKYTEGSPLHLIFIEEGEQFQKLLRHVGVPLHIRGNKKLRACVINIYADEFGKKCIPCALEYIQTENIDVIYRMNQERKDIRLIFSVEYERESTLRKHYEQSEVRTVHRLRGARR